MIMCFYVLVRIPFLPAISAITALGKMRESTIVTYFSVTITIVSLIITSYLTKSIYWYTLIFILCYLITEIVKSSWGLKFMNISIFHVLKDCQKNILCILITFVGLFFGHLIFPIGSKLGLFSLIIISGILFLICQWVFNRKVYFILLDKVKVLSFFKK